MSAEIYLVCKQGGSNKFYHIEVDRASILSPGMVTKSYGRVGDSLKNQRGGQEKFLEHEADKFQLELAKFIASKLKKGYEIKEVWSPVNTPGASTYDQRASTMIQSILSMSQQAYDAADYLFDEGRSSRAGQASRPTQPVKVAPIADVQVTFDVGQTCPVW